MLAEVWETNFLKALEQDDFSRAIEILEQRDKSTGTPRGADKAKALEVIQHLISDLDEAYQWAMRLLQSESATARDLGAMLTATFISSLYLRYPNEAQELILRIADDTHWEVREDADDILLQVLKVDFDKAYVLLQQWAKHPSENIRRAVVLAVKKAGKERRPEWAQPLFDLLEPLLSDRSEYVRKNLGPFAIGDGLLRYYPELTIKRLINWAEAENEQVRWNVAMAFSAAEAAKHLEAALPILSHLATNNRRFVWRAVASAMRNLGRRAPESVMPVLQKWLKDEKRARPAEAALKFLVVGRGTSQKTSPNMGLNPNSAT